MTNKTISLTIPNDDPIALHEFGAAMQRMAHSHGHPVVVPHEVAKGIMTERKAAIREAMTHDTDRAQLAALGAETPHLTREEVEALVDDDTNDTGVVVQSPSHLDSDGLPWDARIHASSKERNADDTWRARRKPSDMDAGQWAEFQGQVRTELRALMELPVEQEVATVLDEQPEPVAPVALDEPTPVVVEPVEPEPIVVTPPPVVAPPAPVEPVVPVAPPAPTGTASTEFVPFLQWITSSGITPEQVNVALAQHGLTAVPQLQQRPDLIPQVHATLAAGV
ncbi:MAG: hypothetical protein ACRCYB_08325 [Aeromonas veronii]